MKLNPLSCIDFYKTGHHLQYPEGTEFVYANFTPRSSLLKDKFVIFFGLQYFIKSFLMETWQEGFFNQPKEKVLAEYKNTVGTALCDNNFNGDHIAALHDLGYLPICIKALPEGAKVPLGVPVLTIVNTHKQFYWLPNFLETALSCYLWKMTTSATTAYKFKQLWFKHYGDRAWSRSGIIEFQCHDFSFRGMSGPYDAAMSGAGHLTSFKGTDSVVAIDLIKQYYCPFSSKDELIGASVPATEHSVMCMGGGESGEFETFKRLITEVHPTGIVSIVSDTWDFWKVLTEYLPKLMPLIKERDGKVVIRPDSGDPVKIICGDEDAEPGSPEHLGAAQLIHNLVTECNCDEGRLGLIYGDSITLERADQILTKLRHKGLPLYNIVFGVGSYTYQYVTRDTYGFAMKATWGVVKGEKREIFKDPKTNKNGEGSAIKKSAKGLLRVEKDSFNNYILYDQQPEFNENFGCLAKVYQDGKLLQDESIQAIRKRIDSNLCDEEEEQK